MLARTSGSERVFLGETRADRAEARFGAQEFSVGNRPFVDVRLDEQLTAGSQHPTNLGEEFARDDQPLVVALLPPRVREVDEDRARASVRKARQSRLGVLGQNSGAIAEPARAQALVHQSRPFASDLEAQDPGVGLRGQALEQKPAATRPDLELDRLGSSPNQEPGIDVVTFREPRRFRVRIRFHLGVDAKTRPVLAQADCPRWLRIARSPWGFLLAAALPATLAVRGVLAATGGEPAVPLDDSYIHFQFARSFAQGHPFVYSPGTAPVAGATSLLWPLLLALPALLGASGTALIPWAWGFGFLSLGLLAYESARAAERITSDRIAWLSGVLVLAFSANTWFAASGMEVVPLAWLLLRCARRAAEWLEGDHSRRWELLLLALVTPATRPEGALGAALIASALLFGSAGRKRLFGALALGFIGFPALVCKLFTGHATQTTTLVKWLPLSPYLSHGALADTVLDNVRLFFGTLLDGQLWSAAYVPAHSRWVAGLALPALVVAGLARRASARAWLLVALGLGILLPTTYDSFLWNRLRYLWPFAAPWLIGLVALADQAGELAAVVSRHLGHLRYLVVAALTGALVSQFPFALGDLADSSRAISSQQVALGRWAKRALDSSARIGVNDTGAIAYFSGHPIFDVVGLTTAGEARYWSAGAGSRFEHYEHLSRTELPTHFIVYPGWFAIPPLLGTCMEERTVHASILGGDTMLACVADYTALGSGEHAAAPELWNLEPLDTLDVADLDSEAAHQYVVLPAAQGEDVVVSDGIVVDGVRKNRSRDSFRLELTPRGRFVARLTADAPLMVTLRVSGQAVEHWTVRGPAFDEHTVVLPEGTARGRAHVEVSAEAGAFGAAHYWLYAASE